MAVGDHRFKYMFALLNSCFMAKFKHGCVVWDTMSKKDQVIINSLIPQTIKQILEMSRSTLTNAVKHDFGLIDLTKEIEMEKILLAAQVIEMDDGRVIKRLLLPMMMKYVPGYCLQTNLKYHLQV